MSEKVDITKLHQLITNAQAASAELEDKLSQEFEQAFTPLADSLNRVNQVMQAFYNRFFKEDWERYPHETLIGWGNRLEATGKFNNPDIRWEYQKTVLLFLATPVTWIWRKIRE